MTEVARELLTAAADGCSTENPPAWRRRLLGHARAGPRRRAARPATHGPHPRAVRYLIFGLIFPGQLTTDPALGFVLADLLTSGDSGDPYELVRDTLRRHPLAPYTLWRFTPRRSRSPASSTPTRPGRRDRGGGGGAHRLPGRPARRPAQRTEGGVPRWHRRRPAGRATGRLAGKDVGSRRNRGGFGSVAGLVTIAAAGEVAHVRRGASRRVLRARAVDRGLDVRLWKGHIRIPDVVVVRRGIDAVAADVVDVLLVGEIASPGNFRYDPSSSTATTPPPVLPAGRPGAGG
jgi:hypothetical protein